MRRLTQREKIELIMAGLAVLFTAFYLLIWPLISKWKTIYAELNDKRQQLEMARNLSQMEEAVRLLRFKIEEELGVKGDPIVSDELFNRIAERFSVGEDEGKLDINRATVRDLMQVEGMDSAKAVKIIEFRRMLGGFSRLEQIKEIRSSIFEEGDEQAAIISKVSQIAKQSGITRIDQLGVRPVVSTKPISVSQRTKLDLIGKLYSAELEAQMDAIKEDRPIKTDLVFPLLPAQLPGELRLRVAEAILRKGSILSREEYKGIISDYLSEISSEDEGLLPIEREIANILAPQMEEVDPNKALDHLMRYNLEVKEKRSELIKLIASLPASYKPRTYLVDMGFKTKLANLVKFIRQLQESYKWLNPRGLRIGVADEKRDLLSIQLTIIASTL